MDSALLPTLVVHNVTDVGTRDIIKRAAASCARVSRPRTDLTEGLLYAKAETVGQHRGSVGRPATAVLPFHKGCGHGSTSQASGPGTASADYRAVSGTVH